MLGARIRGVSTSGRTSANTKHKIGIKKHKYIN